MTVDLDKLEANVRDLITLLGDDPNRPGLKDTPRRVARWWKEFIDYEPGTVNTVFESVHVDQMVVVSGIRIWTLCEHHMLPFYVDVTIGYIATDKVIGISKLARIAHAHSHRLQVQERIVDGIATDVMTITGSPDVAVYGQGEHSCMTMRGIKTPAVMKSTAMFGAFRDEPETRAEFLDLR